jgi:(2Fe-2S) ferredoxin
MSRYQRHVFVCINERPSEHPRGCCLHRGAAEFRDSLKAEINKRGLNKIVRINNAGCLDACEHGVVMVVYPEGIWYGKVTTKDIPEIVEQTIIGGQIIQRLVIADPRYAPDPSAPAALKV